MSTLKHLVKHDPALASITGEECRLISRALNSILVLLSWYPFRWFMPYLKARELELRMLAACLGRTPQEREPLRVDEQIKLAMERDRNGS